MRFDCNAADLACDFVELLTFTQGEFTGKPFRLQPWQREALQEFYGTMERDENTGEEYRKYQYLYLEIPKKNGKTELAAALGLNHLLADGEANGEIYICAVDRANASKCFAAMVIMIKAAPWLEKMVTIVESKKEIRLRSDSSFIRVLSADADNKHGPNPSCVIFDELHAQPNRRLWDVMTFGAGSSRRQPVWIVLTTAGDDPDRKSIGWEIHTQCKKILAARDGSGDPDDDNPIWLPVSSVEEEMATVRAALAEATDGNISAEVDYGEELDTTIIRERELAKAEKDRANARMKAAVIQTEDDYKEALLDEKRVLEELSEAEAHEAGVAKNLQDGVARGYERIQAAIAAITDEDGICIFDTSTTEGAAELEAALTDINQQLRDLGYDKSIESLTELYTFMEDFDPSLDDLAEESETAGESVDALRAKLDKLRSVTEEYEANVISLMRDGWLPTEDACELLGVSEEGLNRKTLALEQRQVAAMTSSQNLAEAHLEEAEAAKAEADAEEEVTTSLEEIASAADAAKYAGGDLRESYNELKNKMDELEKAGDEQARKQAEQALAALNLAATNQELASSYGGLGIAVGDSISSMSGFLIDADVSVDEFISGVTSMRDTVVNSFELIQQNTELTADKMIANLEANLKTQQEWSGNLSSLWEQAAGEQDVNVQAFINYLAEQGPEYASVVEEFAHGGYEKLQEAASTWSEIGTQVSDDYACGISRNQYLAAAAAAGLSQEALDQLENADLSGAGSNVPIKFAANLSGGSDAVGTAAHDMAMNAHTEISLIGWPDLGQAVDLGIANGMERSGSLLADAGKSAAMAGHKAIAAVGWVALGKAIDTGVSNGITRNKSLLSTAGSSAGKSAYSAISGLGWYSLGYSISSGVAQGVSGGSYLITRAATDAANAAYTAAREKLEVNSPSKLFERGVGLPIPEGIALGVTAGTPQMAAAVETSVSQVFQSAKDQLLYERSNILDLNARGIPYITSGEKAVEAGMIRSAADHLASESGVKQIVSAIHALSQKMDKASGDTYRVDNVTYDDGSNVSKVVDSLFRAIRMERRT